MDHIEYARFSICMIAQPFTRVQGFIVPRVFDIHVTYQESGVQRTRIREDIRIVRFQDARFVVLAIFEILITCMSVQGSVVSKIHTY